MALRFLQPESLRPTASTSQVVVGDGCLVVTSGQVALDRDNNLVGAGDFEAQAVQVFENIGHALAAAGADFGHVIRLGAFLADRSYTDDYRSIRTRYFKPPYPASTAVIAELVLPEFLIEIEATALIPAS
ncbi:MAG: RidA family protein [Rhodospirillaceae bacterium]|jgi:2-iminobutanoate/2-iminopropanoate deaminase|nr:RidA family protein [Rhodospirillaceae bacterium]MBT6119282.1 RidA family protein [Rhodospirillaceae bacterium]